MDKFELLQNTADVIQERGDSYGSITQCHQRIAGSMVCHIRKES